MVSTSSLLRELMAPQLLLVRLTTPSSSTLPSMVVSSLLVLVMTPLLSPTQLLQVRLLQAELVPTPSSLVDKSTPRGLTLQAQPAL